MAAKYWVDGHFTAHDGPALEYLLARPGAHLVGAGIAPPQHMALGEGLFKLGSAGIATYPGANAPLLQVAAQMPPGKQAHKPNAPYAWDAMADAAKQHGSLRVLALGPLTNLALALLKYEWLAGCIEGLAFVAGTGGEGDAGPMAEWRAAADAYAVKVVLEAELPRRLHVSPQQEPGLAQLAAAAALAGSSAGHVASYPMEVETANCPSHGRTTLDLRPTSPGVRNVLEAVQVDANALCAAL